MKYLLILLMFCEGCNYLETPHVGDCIYYDATIFKIVKEGKYSFEVENRNGKTFLSSSKNGLTVVDCFDLFDDTKKDTK